MREATSCCNGNCNQGRNCSCGLRATRAAWTCDADDPLELPLFLRVLCVLAAIFCVLIFSGALDQFFPKF